MGENSISNNDIKIIRSREEINTLGNISEKARMFLNSAFDKLDVEKGKPDGKLNRSEGEIFVFNDGAVSVIKDGKLFAGMSAQGAEVQNIGDVLEIKFNDGAESVMKGDKLVSGKTSTNRAFTKEGDKIVFEEAKQPEKAQEPAKVEDVSPKRVSTGSINGVKKQKIDDIASEFIEFSRSIDGRSVDDYEKWIKNKTKFNKKHQRTFRQVLGESESFKYGEINTDVYELKFSPVLNPRTMKYSWDLHSVTELKDK